MPLSGTRRSVTLATVFLVAPLATVLPKTRPIPMSQAAPILAVLIDTIRRLLVQVLAILAGKDTFDKDLPFSLGVFLTLWEEVVRFCNTVCFTMYNPLESWQ